MSLIVNRILNKHLPLSENITSVLSDDDILKLKGYIEKINPSKVYRKNVFHGLHHSEKVLIFAYLIGKNENLDETDMKILLDAAAYHDMARENDYEEVFHGYASSIKVNEAVGHEEFYQNKNNLIMLEAIIDMHSVEDKIIQKIFFNHDLEIEDKERFIKLSKILKDADALDRLRFGSKSPASLKADYLRFEYSKTLVKFSKDINEIYFNELQRVNKIRIEKENEKGENPCFHSIGFDYFKLEPIIKYGILSSETMREMGLKVPRNFIGGNLENWISVVDGKMVENGEAFREFTTHGIGFFCLANKLFKPLNEQGKAIETGYPFNKSGYADEKYVYSKIDPEKIIYLIIPKDYIYMDIREVSYIYNTLNEDLLIDKLHYYIEKTKTDSKAKCLDELLDATEEYKKKLREYISVDIGFSLERESENMQKELDKILVKINDALKTMIYDYFAKILNKKDGEKITVLEAVQFKLLEMNYPCHLTLTGDEALFQLNEIVRQKEY